MNERMRQYIELLCLGARAVGLDAGRRGGAGPSDALAFIFGRHPLTIPTLNKPTQKSRYVVIPKGNSFQLEKDGQILGEAVAVPRPKFYDLKTADGIPYSKIALLHGKDCLGSTVVHDCIRYRNPATRCWFCAIGVSLARGTTIPTKTPEQLAEVAAAAKSLDGVTHVTLTSGTTDTSDMGAEYQGECAQAIKRASGLPVHIQFEPPKDNDVFSRLKRNGVDTVGIHVESFDPRARLKYTPGKTAISLEKYFQAFQEAVAVFGRNQVSTFVILGLGEDEALTLDMCRKTAALGVYPYVVPLRPLLDTFLADADPPNLEYLHRVYQAVGEMLRGEGLSSTKSMAGCVKCGACSLLQFTEEPEAGEDKA